MFKGIKTQYFQNTTSSQVGLYIQHNLNQNPSNIQLSDLYLENFDGRQEAGRRRNIFTFQVEEAECMIFLVAGESMVY